MLELGQRVRVVDDASMDKTVWAKGATGVFIPFEYLPARAQEDSELVLKLAFGVIDGAISTETSFSPVHSNQLEKVADLVDGSVDKEVLKFGKTFIIRDPMGVERKGMVQSIDSNGDIKAIIEHVGYVRVTPEKYEEHVVK